MRLLSKQQVIVRIMAVVSLVEFMVMLVLAWIWPEGGGTLEALVDMSVLALVSAPLIYCWIIAPFVEARDEALQQWSRLAYTDSLTQLANRRYLIEQLRMLISRGRRHGSGGALLLLDLDGFKQINDNHGHEAGDQVLVEVARRLHACTRTEDVAARLGGDEFVVLIDLPEADADSVRARVQRLADKLVSQVSQPVDWHGQRLNVGASIGVRLLGEAGLDAEKVLSQADAALYHAKRSGRGQLVFYAGDAG